MTQFIRDFNNACIGLIVIFFVAIFGGLAVAFYLFGGK